MPVQNRRPRARTPSPEQRAREAEVNAILRRKGYDPSTGARVGKAKKKPITSAPRPRALSEQEIARIQRALDALTKRR